MRLIGKCVIPLVTALLLVPIMGSAAQFDGEWRGGLNCGPSSQNPGFRHSVNVVVRGNAVTWSRETEIVKESMGGTVGSGGAITLNGDGYRKTGSRDPWTTKIDGQFSKSGFKGSGGIFGPSGVKWRDCTADLSRVISPEGGAVAPVASATTPRAEPSRPQTIANPQAVTGTGIPKEAPAPAASETKPTPPQPTPALASVPAGIPPQAVTSGNNPLVHLIDPTVFIGNDYYIAEGFWGSPEQKLFSKATTDWTDQDFQLLEQKLRDHIVSVRNLTAERYRQTNLRMDPDSDSIYLVQKTALEKAIGSIPKFKIWAGQARDKVQAIEMQRLQAEQQKRAEQQRRAEEQKQQELEAQRQAERASRHNNLLLLGFIVILVGGGWGWNKFVRNRCPNCKSAGYDTISREEVDRWRGTKQVTETHSRGKNTRHVQTTYTMMHYVFRCKSCRHEWSKERKEELGGSGFNLDCLLSRLLSGF